MRSLRRGPQPAPGEQVAERTTGGEFRRHPADGGHCRVPDLHPPGAVEHEDPVTGVVDDGVQLARLLHEPAQVFGTAHRDAERVMEKNLKKLKELQAVLYAEAKRALLVVFQAMDAGGKDGAVEHVFSGINPQGCIVHSFKAPTDLELPAPRA